MDDLKFRRAIYTDPTNQDAEIIEAQQQDPKKKLFAQDIGQLDQKIKQALQVPVPDDLCNKLILRQTLARHQVQKRKSRVYLALAASVAIVGGLMLNFIQFSNAYDNLGDYALAHVYHEEGDFDNNSSKTVTLASLNQKMSIFHGKFSQSLGKLIFADYCRFDGMKSLHLVYQGKTSPVTVFIMPKNDQLSFSSLFNDKNFFGSSVEFNQSDVVVIADKNESLGEWQKNINDKVSWTI